MTAPAARLALACLRDGIHPWDMPRALQRAILDLILVGDVTVTPKASEARAERHEAPPVTEDVTRHVTQPLTQAERAKRARDKRKAEAAKRHGAVTVSRDGGRDESVTASRDASRVSLSLSSPQDLSSPPESPPSEPLDETPGASARDPGEVMASRADARVTLAQLARRLYASRYEKEWREMWPHPTGCEAHVDAVVTWAMDQASPAAAIERFIDGAFTPAKWRKPGVRSPWRFIAEDPGATASYSTQPSPSAVQVTRPKLHRQELPSEPAEAGGAF